MSFEKASAETLSSRVGVPYDEQRTGAVVCSNNPAPVFTHTQTGDRSAVTLEDVLGTRAVVVDDSDVGRGVEHQQLIVVL